MIKHNSAVKMISSGLFKIYRKDLIDCVPIEMWLNEVEKRKLASVQYVHHITPIEGADRIECVQYLTTFIY